MRGKMTLAAALIAIAMIAIALWRSGFRIGDRPSQPVRTPPPTPCVSKGVPDLPQPARATRTADPEKTGTDVPAEETPERGQLSILGEPFVTETTKTRRRVLFSTGELYADSPLVDGKQNGTCKCWYKDGHIHAIEEYVNGIREGISTYYSDSGQRIAEGSYFHGYMDGTWISWYENGMKESEGFYDTRRTWDSGTHSQERSGYWAFFLPDGNLDSKRSGVYEHGNLVPR